jgi:DNA-directed RNA polymerase sigma subunit (sigma70/sigma32)
MTEDDFQAYVAAAAIAPILGPDEERELIQASQGGDATARERVLRSGGRLVIGIAGGYVDAGMPLTLLVEAGQVGLERALDRCDMDRGYRFSTFARWYIRQCITRRVAEWRRTGI